MGGAELAVFCASIVGAGISFLWFNAYPASVFMGDVGSLALGGMIGSVAVATPLRVDAEAGVAAAFLNSTLEGDEARRLLCGVLRVGGDRRDRLAVVLRLPDREHRAVAKLGPEARHRLVGRRADEKIDAHFPAVAVGNFHAVKIGRDQPLVVVHQVGRIGVHPKFNRELAGRIEAG